MFFHTDAVQGFGKIPFDVKSAPRQSRFDQAHKIYGPKGDGRALRPLPGTRACGFAPVDARRGPREGRRSGTLNVPGIVGLASAAELAVAEMTGGGARPAPPAGAAVPRDHGSALDEVALNGAPLPRIGPDGDAERPAPRNAGLPGNLERLLAGVEGEALLVWDEESRGLLGSACTSAAARAVARPDRDWRVGPSSRTPRCGSAWGAGRRKEESRIMTWGEGGGSYVETQGELAADNEREVIGDCRLPIADWKRRMLCSIFNRQVFDRQSAIVRAEGPRSL